MADLRALQERLDELTKGRPSKLAQVAKRAVDRPSPLRLLAQAVNAQRQRR